MTDTIEIIQPDDWHCHLRDGQYLKTTVGHIAKQFARAIVMPNLAPPIITVEKAHEYYQQICQAIPKHLNFEPLMTLYLTDNTTAKEIEKAAKSTFVHAAKYYPAGATTHSDSGVTDIHHAFAALEAMEKYGLPLCIHGEVTHPDVDIFDREKAFIDSTLSLIRQKFPQLKIILEHITTKDAVDYVNAANDYTAATITAHHLLYERNILFSGGIKPHYYCLPILKRKPHQLALINAATSGSPKFFLGTDSAPHASHKKENACGCAGIYTAHAAIELYCEVFDKSNALDKLEGFASQHGPNFYGLPINTNTITLKKQDWLVPNEYEFGDESLIPLRAGEAIRWQVVS